MTTAIEKHQNSATALSLADVDKIGKVFHESGFFTDLKSHAQAIVKILAGAEMGIAPFASVQGIHIIQGKPTVGAGLMAQRVKESAKYDYRVMEHEADVCRIEFFERGESIGISTFTLEDARKAQVKNLDKFPRNMLFARAMSNGIRFYCPDVFTSSVYTPDEMGADVSESGEIVAEKTVSAPAVERFRTETEILVGEYNALRTQFEQSGADTSGFPDLNPKMKPEVIRKGIVRLTEFQDNAIESEIVEPQHIDRWAKINEAAQAEPGYLAFIAAAQKAELRWAGDDDIAAFENAVSKGAPMPVVIEDCTAHDWGEFAVMIGDGTLRWQT